MGVSCLEVTCFFVRSKKGTILMEEMTMEPFLLKLFLSLTTTKFHTTRKEPIEAPNLSQAKEFVSFEIIKSK